MMSTDTISPLLTTASPDSKRCSPTEDSQSTALQPPKHIWLLTGPAGCGKTTVAKYLQKQLALPFVEGDDYHSAANKQKMSRSEPLTDGDRWNWLISLRDEAVKQLETSDGVILTCSALKRRYRDVLRVANYGHPNYHLHFIYLRGDPETIRRRVAVRQGHFLDHDGLVASQFDHLEEPESPTEWDALAVDVLREPDVVQRDVLELVKRVLHDDQEEKERKLEEDEGE